MNPWAGPEFLEVWCACGWPGYFCCFLSKIFFYCTKVPLFSSYKFDFVLQFVLRTQAVVLVMLLVLCNNDV